MSDLREDELLQVFNELNVDLGNINPNVVKAWFDTDDPDMKNLLHWMCTSLCKDNYISPLQVTEYNNIELPITNEQLEVEKDKLEISYPGIFDIDYTLLEVEFLKEDLHLAQSQCEELDEEIEKNKKFEEKLTQELTNKVKEEIESSVRLKSTQEKCFLASQKLDDFNMKIHNQLLLYKEVLNKFEFNPFPSFINNFDIDTYEEKVDNLFYLFKSITHKFTENNTNLTMHMDDTNVNDLNNMRHRILQSRRRYQATTFEIERMKAVLSYLEKASVNSLIVNDDSKLKENIATKLETRRRLCEMLEEATENFADNQISEARLKYNEQEIKAYEAHLKELEELEGHMQKMLSHYYILYTMYEQERKDMENYKNLFKKVINYINKDMESCVLRAEKMMDIINDFNANANRTMLRFTKPIIKILSSNDEDNFTLTRAFELLSEFYREIDFLESKLFTPDFSHFKSTGKDLRESIKVYKTFLVSGPTHRVLLVPNDLQMVIHQIEDLLKKQLKSIQESMSIISSSKKNTTKWQKYRRQLWMYFCADPIKLKYILQEIQEEFEKMQKL